LFADTDCESFKVKDSTVKLDKQKVLIGNCLNGLIKQLPIRT
jgi:hypothetical protein